MAIHGTAHYTGLGLGRSDDASDRSASESPSSATASSSGAGAAPHALTPELRQAVHAALLAAKHPEARDGAVELDLSKTSLDALDALPAHTRALFDRSLGSVVTHMRLPDGAARLPDLSKFSKLKVLRVTGFRGERLDLRHLQRLRQVFITPPPPSYDVQMHLPPKAAVRLQSTPTDEHGAVVQHEGVALTHYGQDVHQAIIERFERPAQAEDLRFAHPAFNHAAHEYFVKRSRSEHDRPAECTEVLCRVLQSKMSDAALLSALKQRFEEFGGRVHIDTEVLLHGRGRHDVLAQALAETDSLRSLNVRIEFSDHERTKVLPSQETSVRGDAIATIFSALRRQSERIRPPEYRLDVSEANAEHAARLLRTIRHGAITDLKLRQVVSHLNQEAFFDAISRSSCLRSLDVDNTQLTYVSMHHNPMNMLDDAQPAYRFVEAITCNTPLTLKIEELPETLTTLTLKGFWFEHDGAVEQNPALVLDHLRNLESLTLCHCRLTDAQMPSLVHLPKLRELNLDENKLTDQALQSIAGLPATHALEVVSFAPNFLAQTRVSEEAKQALRDARPGLTVLPEA